jgi:hypothetical protein
VIIALSWKGSEIHTEITLECQMLDFCNRVFLSWGFLGNLHPVSNGSSTWRGLKILIFRSFPPIPIINLPFIIILAFLFRRYVISAVDLLLLGKL